MLFEILLFVHICGAVVGLLAGFMAMTMRKGSGLHHAAGTLFFVAMMAMSSSAAYIARVYRPNALNATVGMLTFYLVTTAWYAARRRDGATSRIDVAGLLYIGAVGAYAIACGIEAANAPRNVKDGMPAPIYFVFGTVALLCTATDVRMLVRGTLAGAKRMVRHLWRMSLALLIATLSLYPGQAKLFPMWLREAKLLFIPHIFLIGAMLYYLVRVSMRRRARAAQVAPPVAVAHGGA